MALEHWLAKFIMYKRDRVK